LIWFLTSVGSVLYSITADRIMYGFYMYLVMNKISLIVVNFLIDALDAGDALINIMIIHTENDIFPRLSIWYMAFKPMI
jgi:hypothetical protein